MSNIMVGSARSASLPDAGEVSEQAFYIHKLGWLVIHPKKKTHRHSIAMAMRNACANDFLRYSQSRRAEIYKRGTNTKVVTYCDCSSLATQIIREAITSNFPNNTTATFPQSARSSGFFEVYDYVDGQTELWNGDLLVTKTKGHIVVVTRGAKKNSGV